MAGPLSSPARRASRSACESGAHHHPVGHQLTLRAADDHRGTGRPEAGDLEPQPDVEVGRHRPGHLGEVDDGRVGRVQGGHAGGVRLDLGQLGGVEPAQAGHAVGGGPGLDGLQGR